MQCCRPTTEDSYFTAKHAVHGPSHLSVDSKRVYINCEEEQGFLFGSLAYMFTALALRHKGYQLWHFGIKVYSFGTLVSRLTDLAFWHQV